MKTQFSMIALLTLVSLNMSGCSSLMPKDKSEETFLEFLSQPQHYALFSPVSIESEEKLGILGVSDYGQRISQQYGIQNPIIGVIEQFVGSTQNLSSTMIVQSEKAKDLPLPPDYPVLFFHSDWNLIYRRIPPSFSMNQLQIGIIGKIIPLAQVLIGHGPTTLRTASWEGKCVYNAFDGEFISLEEWEANNAKLLHQGIEDAQNYCADKFIAEFSNEISSR